MYVMKLLQYSKVYVLSNNGLKYTKVYNNKIFLSTNVVDLAIGTFSYAYHFQVNTFQVLRHAS